MVLPDGRGSGRSGPGKSRLVLFVLAAIAVVAGFLALGALTSGEPLVVEETTTPTTSTTLAEIEPPLDVDDFTVDQIARGKQFEWEHIMSLDDSYPIGLVDHEGSLYLFATESDPYASTGGGMWGWKFEEGGSWEPLGYLIPAPHVISSVASTPQGLVALETGKGQSLTIWSLEGDAGWVPEHVDGSSSNPFLTTYPRGAAGNDRVLVVTGDLSLETEELLNSKLGVGFGNDLRIGDYGWSTEILNGEMRFAMYGPTGFPLVTLTADDLGLSEVEREMISEAYLQVSGSQSGSPIWIRDDSGWRQSELEDVTWVESVASNPRGEITLFGYGPMGLTTRVTRDGSAWIEVPSSEGPYRVDRWRNAMVGPSGSGRASVLVSQSDGSWEDIGPAEHLPAPIEWSIGPLSGGPGGIAAMISGWDPRGPVSSWQIEEVSIRDGDAVLSIDLGSGILRLDKDSSTHSWPMSLFRIGPPDGIEVDLRTAEMIFHDPETGELLASFPLGEIAAAEEKAYQPAQAQPNSYQAFAFTPDGLEWSIQDASSLAGDIDIGLIEVTHSRVVAVGAAIAPFYRSEPPPGFEVWSAAIP